MNKRILIVEDEPTLQRIIKTYFEKNGYDVYVASDGEQALTLFKDTILDIIVLDIMLPKIDGFEVCKIIRSSSNIPVIMMTALGEEQNMLYGYSLKVDDYIIKPFPPKVLVAKVNNLLSRIQKPEELIKIYEVGGIKIDYNANIAYVDNKQINLSKTEFDLLCFFIQNQDKACSRELLLDEVWGMDVYVDYRIIDTYIKQLRKAIKPYSYIKTVFKVGYKFSLGNDNEENNQ